MEWLPRLLYLNFKDFFRSLFLFSYSEQASHYPVCTVFMQIYLILYLIRLPQLSGLSSPTWLTIFFPYCWIKFARSDRKQLMAQREKERRGVGKTGQGVREKGRDRDRENKFLKLILVTHTLTLEKGMAIQSSILAWRIPRKDNPMDRGAWQALQSMGL